MSFIQPTGDHEIIQQSVQQLARKYAGKFDENTIHPVVVESFESFNDATVRSFIAVFTTRYADDRLRAMAKNQGLLSDTPPSVLFVCVHNAGRSQMAAGWLRHLSKGKIEVYSGGSMPGKDLNTAAVEAMREVGVDITSEFPKPLTMIFTGWPNHSVLIRPWTLPPKQSKGPIKKRKDIPTESG